MGKRSKTSAKYNVVISKLTKLFKSNAKKMGKKSKKSAKYNVVITKLTKLFM